MGHFILVVVVGYLLFLYPIAAVIGGVILAGLCYMDKYKLVQKDELEKLRVEKKDEFNMADYDPVAEAAKAVESKLNPGYKDDPKWQEMTKDINKIVDENQRKAEKEEEIEGLKVETPRKSPQSDPKPTRAPTKATITVQDPPLEMTEQEIHDVMQELTDTF